MASSQYPADWGAASGAWLHKPWYNAAKLKENPLGPREGKGWKNMQKDERRWNTGIGSCCKFPSEAKLPRLRWRNCRRFVWHILENVQDTLKSRFGSCLSSAVTFQENDPTIARWCSTVTFLVSFQFISHNFHPAAIVTFLIRIRAPAEAALHEVVTSPQKCWNETCATSTRT